MPLLCNVPHCLAAARLDDHGISRKVHPCGPLRRSIVLNMLDKEMTGLVKPVPSQGIPIFASVFPEVYTPAVSLSSRVCTIRFINAARWRVPAMASR